MGIPAKPTGASTAVAPNTVSTNTAVRITSTRNAAVSV
jgi:hypothetical protein